MPNQLLQPLITDDPARAALRWAAGHLDVARASGHAYPMARALVQLGRAYRGVGEYAAAEAACSQALGWSRMIGSIDMNVDLLCELCEAAAAHAETLDDGEPNSGRGHATREQARAFAQEAAALAGSVADPRWEICVLLRISDVLDRFGDREDAIVLQCRALKLMSAEAAADPQAPTAAACLS